MLILYFCLDKKRICKLSNIKSINELIYLIKEILSQYMIIVKVQLYLAFVLPHKTPINTVVGKPINLIKIENCQTSVR